MRTNPIIRLAQLGCGQEMLNSCNERGQLEAAISNCNKFIKYAKQCLKNYEETKLDFWKEAAEVHLLPYYNELLSVEFLADKYKELYKEKFCKSKLIAAKILNR